MFTSRALLEGKWQLMILAVVTALTALWSVWVAIVPFLLLVFTISFFRDPEVSVPAAKADIVAPGWGRIVEIRKATEPAFIGGEATMVAIFLSVFDVHTQRSPVAGTVKLVKYFPGKFLDVRHPDAGTVNEFRLVGIETNDGYKVAVKQIAGLIARRIVGWADEGTKLEKGERFGMIKFGSRVELFLPGEVEVVAKVGEYAKGGVTVLARRKS
jgi:phosphatidylserine decarboxylase